MVAKHFSFLQLPSMVICDLLNWFCKTIDHQIKIEMEIKGISYLILSIELENQISTNDLLNKAICHTGQR